MISIVCFDLVPEALEISGIPLIILGILFGVICMIACDILVQKKFNTKIKDTKKGESLLKTGIVVGIGLALHNFPEGLSIRGRFWSINKTWILTSTSNTTTRHSRTVFQWQFQ